MAGIVSPDDGMGRDSGNDSMAVGYVVYHEVT